MFTVRYSIEGQNHVVFSKSAKKAMNRAVTHIGNAYLLKGAELFSIALFKGNEEIMSIERGSCWCQFSNCDDRWYRWVEMPYIDPIKLS